MKLYVKYQTVRKFVQIYFCTWGEKERYIVKTRRPLINIDHIYMYIYSSYEETKTSFPQWIDQQIQSNQDKAFTIWNVMVYNTTTS